MATYPPAIPEDVVQLFIASIASATNFLQGSTSKRIPYEIAHCLRLASADWTTRPTLITTALSPDLYRGFYFLGVPSNFYTLADSFLDVQFQSELVQISLPDIYRRRPLYCTPLYHELGHFIDMHRGVTTRSLISKDHGWPLPGVNLATFNDDAKKSIQTSHRMEYFADLFSASFTGKCSREFLRDFAGDQPVSYTHPATSDRIKVVDDFLTGQSNPVVELFQETLTSLTLPNLSISYTSPDIVGSFDNVRPYMIKDKRELHGTFDAAWTYLKEIWDAPRTQWAQLEQFRREQSVNDLVEKSIRNHMIQEKWNPHAVA